MNIKGPDSTKKNMNIEFMMRISIITIYNQCAMPNIEIVKITLLTDDIFRFFSYNSGWGYGLIL